MTEPAAANPDLSTLTVEVLWADLPLWVANRYVRDRGRTIWDATRIPILQAAAGALGWDDYDDLTVAEHAEWMTVLGIPWPDRQEADSGVQ